MTWPPEVKAAAKRLLAVKNDPAKRKKATKEFKAILDKYKLAPSTNKFRQHTSKMRKRRKTTKFPKNKNIHFRRAQRHGSGFQKAPAGSANRRRAVDYDPNKPYPASVY